MDQFGTGHARIFLSWDAFLYGVQHPDLPFFDEVRYVSAARQHLGGEVNENWVHPPLAKWLMSTGLRLWGDNPLGWRFMSTLFGALTVALTFVLGLLLFGGRSEGFMLALLTLLNQVHYVQSRVAALDVFMVTFIMAGVCVFAYLWLKGSSLSLRAQILWMLAGGFAFGCAIACKWFAIAPAAVCWMFALWRLNGSRRQRLIAAATCAIAPLLIYFLASLILLRMSAPSYQPALGLAGGMPHQYSLGEVLRMQIEIAKTQLAYQNPRHPYTSEWYTWPLMIRPMWYSFQEYTLPSGGRISAVFLVGNPLIFWFGFAAVAVCLWFAAVRRAPESIFLCALFLASWLVWAILPRKLGFFYYYYPASLFLAPALMDARRKLKVPNWMWYPFALMCLAAFAFFYPILCGADFPAETIWSRFLLPSWSN